MFLLGNRRDYLQQSSGCDTDQISGDDSWCRCADMLAFFLLGVDLGG